MTALAKRACGFSLVEVMVALTLVGLASSTLLLATASTVQSGNDALAQTIARGIAEQLLDEVLGQPYHERGGAPASWPLGPEGGETSNPPRTILFDDTDDYSGYSVSPRDAWGFELGQGNGSGGLRAEQFRLPANYFASWNARITVVFVDENDPTKDLVFPATSIVRAVRVQITRQWNGGTQELVNLRRVFAYVPPVRP